MCDVGVAEEEAGGNSEAPRGNPNKPGLLFPCVPLKVDRVLVGVPLALWMQ